MSDTYLNECKEWFDSNDMDFSIECVDGKWYCSAWFRSKWGGVSGRRAESVLDSIGSCIDDAKKEIEDTKPKKKD